MSFLPFTENEIWTDTIFRYLNLMFLYFIIVVEQHNFVYQDQYRKSIDACSPFDLHLKMYTRNLEDSKTRAQMQKYSSDWVAFVDEQRLTLCSVTFHRCRKRCWDPFIRIIIIWLFNVQFNVIDLIFPNQNSTLNDFNYTKRLAMVATDIIQCK